MKKKPLHAGLKVRRVEFKSTKPHPENPRIHPPKGSAEYERLRASLANEYFDPLVWNERNGKMVSGHYRRTVLMDEGFASADMVVVDWNEATHKARMIAANELNGSFDDKKLLALVQQIEAGDINAELTGMTDERIRALIASAEVVDESIGARESLSQKFGVPPFSVLDARQGYWQERKRAWLALGIQSEVGRGGNLLKMSETIRQPDPKKRGLGALAVNKEMASEGLEHYRHKNRGTDSKAFGTEGNAAKDWTGTSIFDPVLCEMAYRWFVPPNGRILDPFAGGSVRGVVAGLLGREYVGVDLRKEQVEANRQQWEQIKLKPLESTAGATVSAEAIITDPAVLTPIQQSGNFFFKRDDLFDFGGANGGKARALFEMGTKAKGLVTCGDRQSTQIPRAAQVAKALGIPCRLHTAKGADTPGMATARSLGAEIIQHDPGYLSQCKKWAHDDAAELGYFHVPWANLHPDAIALTAEQVKSFAEQPHKPKRLVVPVGSGATLAGILRGMNTHGIKLPVLGILLGADHTKALNEFAPKGWEKMVKFEKAKQKFHDEAPKADQTVEGIALDPVYEAKCVPFLKPGDCLWIVGRRPQQIERRKIEPKAPTWIEGDSSRTLGKMETDPSVAEFDFLWTCPPYFDLEVYSDDPKDLSTAKTYKAFITQLADIIFDGCALLKGHAFAGIVVGDIRDENGLYRNFVSDTIACFEHAGLKLYNEAILVTSVGTLPIRIAKQFTTSRKLGKTHQNVLFFVKGDPRKATASIGPVEFGAVPEAEGVEPTESEI